MHCTFARTLLAFLLPVAFCSNSWAASGRSTLRGSAGESKGGSHYAGRLTSGGYLSQEKFVDTNDGSTRNDFFTLSNRLYFNAYDLGSSNYDFVSDLRDKHDFFDKLDKERLSLNSTNAFQLRQLSLSNPNENGRTFWTMGRFPVAPAGSVDTTGVNLSGTGGKGSINRAVKRDFMLSNFDRTSCLGDIF